MIAFALVLLLAAASGWIAAAGAPARERSYLRAAAALYGALALGEMAMEAVRALMSLPALSALIVMSITDLVVTLGSAVLCAAAWCGFRGNLQPASTAAVLGLSALIGLAAALTGFGVFAAVPQVLSALIMLLVARQGLWQRASCYLALSAFSLLGGAACQLTPGLASRAGVLLFESAALIGVAVASDVLVEQRQQHKRALAIGRSR